MKLKKGENILIFLPLDNNKYELIKIKIDDKKTLKKIKNIIINKLNKNFSYKILIKRLYIFEGIGIDKNKIEKNKLWNKNKHYLKYNNPKIYYTEYSINYSIELRFLYIIFFYLFIINIPLSKYYK
jgi:hypothetical protein